MKYEVETDLIVHCKIKVTVDADSKDSAIDATAELLPNNNNDRATCWKAKVEFKPPPGIIMKFVKAIHFEQASGSDKARKIEG